jgi:hypothetical protein
MDVMGPGVVGVLVFVAGATSTFRRGRQVPNANLLARPPPPLHHIARMSLRIIATVTFSLLVLASFYGLSRLSACELDTRKQGHLLPANIAHAAAAEAALAAPPNPASQPHASSSPSDPSPVRHCTEQEKKTQVSLIRHAKVKGCSGKGDVLMRIVQLASPKSRVFIDM